MENCYHLLFKTGESEIKAIKEIDFESLSRITPIIEITRGRKKTINNISTYPYESRVEQVLKCFKSGDIILDVTSDDNLSSDETEKLYNPSNGYQNWVSILKRIKEEYKHLKIIPTILINFDSLENFEDNFKKQIESLYELSDVVAYRNSILDEDFYQDLDIIKQAGNKKSFYYILDCGYVPQASQHTFAEKCKSRIKNLKERYDFISKIILISTSFPNNISEIGNDKEDTFKLVEVALFEEILKLHNDIHYGDYGSINPIRNDTVTMARGWVPRIDVPLQDEIYYYREHRQSVNSEYYGVYKTVAQKVLTDSRFPNHIKCWGINEIKYCADWGPRNALPRYWISVRMNIHIQQQLSRLILSPQ